MKTKILLICCLVCASITLTSIPCMSQNSSIVITPTVTNASCPGYSNGAISISVSGGLPDYSYMWSTGATTSGINGLSSGDYTMTVTDANSDYNIKTVTVGEPPALTVGPIAGTSTLCTSSGQTLFYAISPVPAATSYLWTVPSGVNLTAGQGTTFITVTMIAGAIANGIKGNICVVAINACESSALSCLTLDINSVAPVTPPSISGSAKVCPGDTIVYSIGTVSRATQYQWTMPAGATIVTGSGTNIIKVAFGSGFAPGIISVRACNSCGCSPSRNRNVNLNPISTPVSLSGQLNGVCNGSFNYSIPVITAVKGYTWSLTGSGASFTGGNSGLSVNVNYTNAFNTATLGVSAFNGCGVSSERTATIKGVPAMPGPITGSTSVCINTTYPYSVNTVQGTITYTWTAPSTITGQGSKNITVSYGTVPVINQVITVTSSNECGTGPMRSLSGINVGLCTGRMISDNNLAVRAFPNPANDLLFVYFNVADKSDYLLRLSDITGRTISEETGTGTGEEVQHSLDVHDFAKGIYVVQLTTYQESYKIKVIVE